MNRLFPWILCICSCAASAVAAIPMARVVEVTASDTIVVETGGKLTTVVLRGISLPAQEAPAAAAYLRHLLEGAWVLIEEGDVYRSPDALYVNGEIRRQAWRAVPGMRVLGEANPAPRARAQRETVRPPRRSARSGSPSGRRSSARPRRSRTPPRQ